MNIATSDDFCTAVIGKINKAKCFRLYHALHNMILINKVVWKTLEFQSLEAALVITFACGVVLVVHRLGFGYVISAN